MTRRVAGLPLALGVVMVLSLAPSSGQTPVPPDRFDDPLFRQCIAWMLDARGGGLLGNRCMDEYALPTPSLFQCARKVATGFDSPQDREGCALIFEDRARQVRAGFVR
jgi:hypothetical protein